MLRSLLCCGEVFYQNGDKLTRKDYVLIARAVNDARNASERELAERDGIDAAVEYIADALATDNPRFDRTMFMLACGRWPTMTGESE